MQEKLSPVTLKDIAKVVGVTPSTVSAVLNNAPKAARYTEETKTRIRQTARKLGYVSNPLAQALRGHATNLLGFVSYTVDSNYYGHILNAIEKTADKAGYQIVVSNMQKERQRLDICIQMMLRLRVRGIILGNIGNAIGDTLTTLVQTSPVPMVNLGSPEPGVSLPSVNLDNTAASKIILDYLLSLQHKNLLLLEGPQNLSYFRERSSSFSKHFHEKIRPGRGTLETITVPSPTDFATAYRTMSERIEKGVNFTAIVGANDIIAMGAMRSLLDHGVKVPETVSIAGIDDMPWSGADSEGARLMGYIKPSLTSLRVPVANIASMSAAKLIQLVENKENKDWRTSENELLPPELIVRESTAPARVA
ncbi:MAG: hypothetical protein RLZZ303_2719 [Candidatus Hydrogenedentota bacterium]|jgi:DNA-binding LacI/PurR family transcriptional regulator